MVLTKFGVETRKPVLASMECQIESNMIQAEPFLAPHLDKQLEAESMSWYAQCLILHLQIASFYNL